jgi:hypothetical protein
MKKTLIIGALVAGTLSAYSQGTINFLDRQSDMTIHIFAPQLLTPTVETMGNQGLPVSGSSTLGVSTDALSSGGNTTYGGATVYTGGAIGNTLAANPTAAGLYHYNNGSDYTVELYAAPGANAAASALQPVSQYTTIIYTSSTLGGIFKNVIPGSDPGLSGAAFGGTATVALYAWYNGGTGLSYSAALQAGDPTGISDLITLTGLGNPTASPPVTAPDLIGLTSFSLVTTPEPSTIALGVIGASAFLFRRRK